MTAAPSGRPLLAPIAVPLRELVRIGRSLGVKGDACLDAERVSRAARKADPGCAGYRVVSYGHGGGVAPRGAES